MTSRSSSALRSCRARATAGSLITVVVSPTVMATLGAAGVKSLVSARDTWARAASTAEVEELRRRLETIERHLGLA
jgi:type II secretory pathway component PulJ